MKKAVALIGHSGAGKTTSVKMLEEKFRTADMDEHFRFDEPVSNDAVNDWIMSGYDFVSIGVHGALLNRWIQDKRDENHEPFFENVRFVYLKNDSLESLRQRLSLPSAHGYKRSPETIEKILKDFSELDLTFTRLADNVIHTGNIEIEDVVRQLSNLASSD